MSQKSRVAPYVWVVVFFGLLAMPVLAADGNLPDRPPIMQEEIVVADVVYNAQGLSFFPKISYQALIVSVSSPDGAIASKTFVQGSTPYFGFSDFEGIQCLDGQYTFELRVVPFGEKKNRTTQEAGTMPKVRSMALVQSGSFQVVNGSIINNSGMNEDRSRVNDVLHYDDVIITGSLCIGFDCANGESFGYDTLKLKENNLRMYFEDTSAGSFPTGDWRFLINDTTSGGASYFSVQDATNNRRIFTLETGAPTHSLYVEDYGRIGLGTSIPYVELHIVDGDSPTIRLDQDGSSGWVAQRWDLCGNETNFFVRDVTNGSKLCFRIQPNTPSNTLCMRSSGNVGVGTWSPEYSFEVERTGEGAMMVADRTDGATMEFSATGSYGIAGTRTNHSLRLRVNNDHILQINSSGNYLQVYNSSGTSLGNYNGTWNDSSSRELKENIANLTDSEAENALEALNPVKYNYKFHKSEARVGFIAEDVPELIANEDRKSLSTMDITAVLTKVVQKQNKRIEQLEKELAKLKKK